jgi:hypothetical protein
MGMDTTWHRAVALGLLSLVAATSMSGELPMPKGFVERHTGFCKVVVRPQNWAVVSELDEVCGEDIEHIYSTLGQDLKKTGDLVEIRVVSSPEEMKTVAPEETPPPPWSGAVAYPQYGLVIIPLRNHLGSPILDLTTVMKHELSHLALRQGLKDAKVPRWFSEGVAIHLSEKSSIERHWLVWLAARRNGLLPLSEIEQYPEQSEINLAYAEAADFFGNLLDDGGWGAVRAVIRRVREGSEFEEAILYAYNQSLASLEQSWRSDLGSRWQWVPLITGTGAVWGGIVGLFFLAYTMAKRRRKKKMKEMESEEAAIEQVITTIDELKKRALPAAPKAKAKERVPTKIRVDDEIHTLH